MAETVRERALEGCHERQQQKRPTAPGLDATDATDRLPARMSSGESVVDPRARATALEEAIAIKERRGFRVESQSETEARVIRLGRKRWFGIFGGRVPETREILRVDEWGKTTVEKLPPRRY